VERLGLVGLPNSGKSSLFNALTGGHAAVASHPFSTTETAVGVAPLPDARLDALAKLSQSKKVVHAGVEIVDIAGLVAGASTGEGLGNRFLAGIREVDALMLVLRAFHDDEAPGEDDPLASLETLELELVMADAASLEHQGDKRRKQARLKNDRTMAAEADAIDAALEVLHAGTPLYRAGMDAEQRARLHDSFLLTDKRLLAVVNLAEDQVDKETADALVSPVAESLGAAGEVLGVCVQLEAEAAQLAPEERVELLEGLGLGEGVLPRVAHSAFHLLGLRTFLTTGEKESRAWTFRAGAHAPECAGVIHSDLERGFIRAEVIHWDELVELGGWPQAKAAGRLRVEGKDYEVLDGDVLEIRFNV
jgi:ribosome-binding ATPase